MKKNYIARRRGTSVAAAALSFALVAPFASPVASAAPAGEQVETVDGYKVQCGIDPDDPKSKYRTELVNTDGAIVADAIANGYIRNGLGLTNAAQTLSGWVGTAGYGTVTPGSGRKLEDGVKVFMQWKDNDGTVSPVYQTETHTIPGAQGGKGTYAFDLREGFTDSNGELHLFQARNDQLIRVWVEPQVEERSGLLMYPLRSTPGMTTGVWTSSDARLGATRLAGKNLQRVHLWMGYLPVDPATGESFMVAEDVSENPVPGLGDISSDYVKGRVWHETGLGTDRGNIVTGPTWKAPAGSSKDAPAVGYKVYFTTLTEDGVNGLANAHDQDDANRPGMVADLVKEHPEWLRKTWVATTDENGEYILDMKGDPTKNNMYMWVESPDGTVVQTHSPFTRMEFRRSFLGAENWIPQALPNALASGNGVSSVNFAVTGSPEINNLGLHVVNFNNMDKLAYRGDTAELAIDGALPGTVNRIVWTNAAGEVVDPATGEPTGQDANDLDTGTPIKQCGDEANAALTVPESAQDGDTFTAWFYAGPNPVASDSFSVTADQAAEVDPRYGQVFFDEDPETDGYQSLPPKFFREDRNGVKVDKDNDVTDSVEGEEYSFAPNFRIPLKDAEGNPVTEQARDADGTPQFEMEPVLDANGEPEVDADGNPVMQQATDEDGNPVPVLEPKYGVPEGFEIDPATGVVTIPENYLPKQGEQPVKVPVRVTYADGSIDVAEVVVHPKKKLQDVFEPGFEDNLVVPGEESTTTPTFTKDGEPIDKVPAGTEFVIPEDFEAPGYDFDVDRVTGEVTVTVDPEFEGDRAEEITVPVEVTYRDGSKDDAEAKFQLDTDGDGIPDVTDEDDDGDGVSDEDEKAAGTDPKDGSSVPTTVDESGKKDVAPSGEPQDTGVVIKNPTVGDADDSKNTTVSAKDEDDQDVPVRFDEDGKIIVTPPTNVDGPITVTVTDPQLPGGKQDVTIDVVNDDGTKHKAGQDDNNNGKPGNTSVDPDQQADPVKVGDGDQNTGVKVTNPDGDTEVTATDEDGNPVKVIIDKDGNIVVNPDVDPDGNPIDVDGPIKVVVKDPDLVSEDNPNGEVEITVPVIGKDGNEHKAGQDDNNNGKPGNTSVDPDQQADPVKVGDGDQNTGVKVTNPDGDTEVTATDEDGNPVKVIIDKDGNIVVNPDVDPDGNPIDVDGPIKVVVKDPDLVSEDNPKGEVEITVPVIGKDGNEHKAGQDDNNNGKPGNTDGNVTDSGEIRADGRNHTIVKPGSEKKVSTVKVVLDDPTRDAKAEGIEAGVDKNGNIYVNIPRGTAPGTGTVIVSYTDGSTEEFRFTIKPGLTDEEVGKCIASSVGFGLPLLALIPLGIAITVGLPGLEPQIKQFNKVIEDANTSLQRQLGIFNPEMARQAAEVNAQLKQVGMNLLTGAGILLLIPLIIGGAFGIANACIPGGLSEAFGSSDDR